jgi:peptidoglycan/LPS O-acetylase OafA/YrhL
MTAPTGEQRSARLRYHSGLDGIRALAVTGVLLYHGGVSWAGGGFLGVELFFVLSGFLITSLLLAEWSKRSTISLGAFWARRARRLLPALFCLVVVIGIYYALAGPEHAVPGLKRDGLSTLFYLGNWHEIASGSNYFATAGPVSPFKHTWSLAIEEQFYLCWPLLLLAILWLTARLRWVAASGTRRRLQVLLALSMAGALASAVDIALRFDGGHGLDRVYYGTDTRAGGLLIGASLAIALALRGARDAAPRTTDRWRSRSLLSAASLLATTAVLAEMNLAAGGSPWLYPLGFTVLDIAAATVIAAVVLRPGSPVARFFSLRPLRMLGQISYGVYLWHFPLFLWLDAAFTGVSGAPLLLVRLTATLLVSVASFVVVEQPIRRGWLPPWLVRWMAPVAAGGAVAVLLAATSVASPSLDAAAAAQLPPGVARRLRGSDPPCQVQLRDSKQYGLAPPAAERATAFEYASLGSHRLSWSGSSRLTFHTCPPKRVLVIGDSLAFTLGVGLMEGEQRYGVEVINAAILGCAFTTSGQLNVAGRWESQSSGCPTALRWWTQLRRALHPDAVVVELGYRDQFEWRIGGRVVHLGTPAFDAYLQRQINTYVRALDGDGEKLLFLSVPWSHPPSMPDGSPAPAASPARHRLINRMLATAARDQPGVRMLDIDKVVSPGDRYHADVNGHLCRFDGVHFSVFCSKVLQPTVLRTVREMIGP